MFNYMRFLLSSVYFKLFCVGLLSYGAYISGAYVLKFWKKHRFEREIQQEYERRVKEKDKIESFQIEGIYK